jgi:hypothetical protein
MSACHITSARFSAALKVVCRTRIYRISYSSFLLLSMTSYDQKTKVSIRSRHHHLSWMSESDREASARLNLSEESLLAIVRDTRLPGEIAGAFGLSAAVVLKIQRAYRSKRGS